MNFLIRLYRKNGVNIDEGNFSHPPSQVVHVNGQERADTFYMMESKFCRSEELEDKDDDDKWDALEMLATMCGMFPSLFGPGSLFQQSDHFPRAPRVVAVFVSLHSGHAIYARRVAPRLLEGLLSPTSCVRMSCTSVCYTGNRYACDS
jgi:hypothetical protein